MLPFFDLDRTQTINLESSYEYGLNRKKKAVFQSKASFQGSLSNALAKS
jgi:hypothetical protein